MFSNALIALIFAIGFGGWVYAKTQKSTGGNTRSSLIVAAGAGLVGFFALLFILQTFFKTS